MDHGSRVPSGNRGKRLMSLCAVKRVIADQNDNEERFELSRASIHDLVAVASTVEPSVDEVISSLETDPPLEIVLENEPFDRLREWANENDVQVTVWNSHRPCKGAQDLADEYIRTLAIRPARTSD